MKPTVGILAYGSLLADPGVEIASAIAETKEGIETPFNVEFARSSRKRRGAPTLVPVADHGEPVRASLLVLNVGQEEATNRLYRREINKIGSDRRYNAAKNPGPNTVVIRSLRHFEGVDVVLYTKIAANISPLTADELAKRAIESAKGLADGRDGISYLMDAKKYGIRTQLSQAYEDEIKRQLQAKSLCDALRKVQQSQ